MDYFEFKNNIPAPDELSALLITGEDSYLRKDAIQRMQEEGNFQKQTVRGEKVDPADLEERLRSRTMFDQSRLVVVSDPDGRFLKDRKEWIQNYLEHPSTEHLLLIECPSPHGNLKSVRLLKESGQHVSCGTPDKQRLQNWVRRYFQRSGLQIGSDATDELLSRTGEELQVLQTEMEKLELYCRGKDVVSASDVKNCVTQPEKLGFFDFTDGWLEGNYEEVISDLRRQIREGSHETKISGGLLWALRRLRLMVDLYKIGFSTTDISSYLEIREWVVKKHLQKWGEVDSDRLKEASEGFLKKDLLVRSGTLPPDLSLELLVLDGFRECDIEFR